MPEENLQQTSNQSQNKKLFGQPLWVLILLAVLIVVLIGGALYFIQSINSTERTESTEIDSSTSSPSAKKASEFSFENSVAYIDFGTVSNANKGEGSLILQDIDNGSKKIITEKIRGFSSGSNSGPNYSPDKKVLAYVSDHNLYLIDNNSLDKPIQVTTEGGLANDEYYGVVTGNLMWSPDGKKIAYRITNQLPPHKSPGQKEKKEKLSKAGLYIVDNDGKNKKFLGTTSVFSWGPDSKSFVIWEANKDNTGNVTRLWNFETGKKRKILDTQISSICIPQSGDRIAYSYRSDDQQVVFIGSRDFSNPIKIFTGIAAKLCEISPVDENMVLLWSQVQTGVITGDIVVKNIETDKVKTLVSSTNNTSVFWSSDGKKIIYLKLPLQGGYYAGGGDLYVLDIDTGKEEKITSGYVNRLFNY